MMQRVRHRHKEGIEVCKIRQHETAAYRLYFDGTNMQYKLHHHHGVYVPELKHPHYAYICFLTCHLTKILLYK